MSEEALEAKRKQSENYFIYHPDSREISIVGSSSTFPGLFDNAYFSDTRDGGNVEQQKRMPHVTFYSGYASLFTPRTTKIDIGGVEYTVYAVKCDKTDGTFQGELWLV